MEIFPVHTFIADTASMVCLWPDNYFHEEFLRSVFFNVLLTSLKHFHVHRNKDARIQTTHCSLLQLSDPYTHTHTHTLWPTRQEIFPIWCSLALNTCVTQSWYHTVSVSAASWFFFSWWKGFGKQHMIHFLSLLKIKDLVKLQKHVFISSGCDTCIQQGCMSSFFWILNAVRHNPTVQLQFTSTEQNTRWAASLPPETLEKINIKYHKYTP